MEVERRAGQDDAGQATEEERDEEADRPQHRRLEGQLDPRHIVPIQLKNFTPVGTAMSIVMSAKNGSSTEPVDVHVVRPHGHRQRRDRDRRVDEGLVAEDRLAAEDREDLGDDAEERQRDDVDLGVPEEPEQVLPEDGAAVLRVEHLRAETPVRAEREAARRPAAGTP